jgi:hypothetical protein
MIKLYNVFLLLLIASVGYGQGLNCSSAGRLTPSLNSCQTRAFNIFNGRDVGSTSCVSNVNDDGWFFFAATANFTSVVLDNANQNIALVVYTGNCSSLVEVACNDQGTTAAAVTLATTIGTRYLVRIIRTSIGVGSTSGEICVSSANACATTTLLNEQFNTNSLTGAITSAIFGTGTSSHNAAFVQSPARFGWFNLRTGLSGRNVYDRTIPVSCIGIPVTVNFQTRRSFGTTNVTFSIIDDNGTNLINDTRGLNSFYEPITYTFTPQTANVRFILTMNSAGGTGNDVCLEDLLVTQCCPSILLGADIEKFTGVCRQNTAELNWTVGNQETNPVEYTIEHSANAIDFKALSEEYAIELIEKDKATTALIPTKNVVDGINYFRLKQLDVYGEITYSSLISMTCRLNKNIALYPNPVQGQLEIRGQINHKNTLQLYNSKGQLIQQTMYTVDFEMEKIRVNTQQLSTGFYIIHTGTKTFKFIKL